MIVQAEVPISPFGLLSPWGCFIKVLLSRHCCCGPYGGKNMKQFLLVCGVLFSSGMAQAAQVAVATDTEPSSLLLVLAGVALIGTIAHRRSKLKART